MHQGGVHTDRSGSLLRGIGGRLGLVVTLTCASCGGRVGAASRDGGVVEPLAKLTVGPTVCTGTGSYAAVDVTIERLASQSGPIVLTVDSPPAFLSISPITITGNRGILRIGVYPDAPPGTVHLTASALGSSAAFDVIIGTQAGSRDLSFGTDGFVTLPLLGSPILARQDDALIVAASDLASATIMRIKVAGASDSAFGIDGTATLDRALGALGVRGDGALVAATTEAKDCVPYTGLSRDGANPTDVIGPGTCGRNGGKFIFEARDRSIFLGGYIYDCCGFLDRFRADGTPDTTFGVDGQIDRQPFFINSVHSGAMLDDGRTVLGEYQKMQIVNPDGSLSFDESPPLKNNETFYYAVAGATDVVYGAGATGTPPSGFLRALGANGAPLATFGSNGIIPLPIGRALAGRRDGSVVALTDGGLYEISPSAELTYLGPRRGATAMIQDACGRIVTARSATTSTGGGIEVTRYWP